MVRLRSGLFLILLSGCVFSNLDAGSSARTTPISNPRPPEDYRAALDTEFISSTKQVSEVAPRSLSALLEDAEPSCSYMIVASKGWAAGNLEDMHVVISQTLPPPEESPTVLIETRSVKGSAPASADGFAMRIEDALCNEPLTIELIDSQGQLAAVAYITQ